MSADPNNQEQSTTPQPEGQPPSGIYPPSYWYPPPAERYDEISLADLWDVVVSKKWFIFAATLVCTTAALAYAILATPIYRAETLLAPVEKESQSGLTALAGRFGGLADLAGLSLPSGGDVETALATLESRDFVTRFIREEELKPALFPDRWNADTRSWLIFEPSYRDKIMDLLGPEHPDRRSPDLAPGEPTDWDAFKLFQEEIIRVSSDPKTSLVRVTIEWRDPRLAAHWANLLVERLNYELRQQAVERAQKSIEYLRQQIDETSLADLRTVLFGLIEEHTKTITLAKVSEEYVFHVIDPAVVPQEKAKPRRFLITVLGFALGCLVGLMLAFLKMLAGRQRANMRAGV